MVSKKNPELTSKTIKSQFYRKRAEMHNALIIPSAALALISFISPAYGTTNSEDGIFIALFGTGCLSVLANTTMALYFNKQSKKRRLEAVKYYNMIYCGVQ